MILEVAAYTTGGAVSPTRPRTIAVAAISGYSGRQSSCIPHARHCGTLASTS